MNTTQFSKEEERIFKSYGATPHNKLENRFLIETPNGTLILRAEAERIINAIYSMLQNCEDLKDMKSNTGYEFNIYSGKCNFYDDVLQREQHIRVNSTFGDEALAGVS